MTSRRGPPSSSADSCLVFSSIPACRANTAPDLVGSITKHTVSAPRNTHSHQRTEPPGCPPWLSSRGAKTRQVVSSACRCQESRDRAVIASATGTSSAPAWAHAPASVAAEISAPCRARPVTREFMLRPDTYRSVNSIAMNPLDNRPLPIAFGGPGAITVAGTCTRPRGGDIRLQLGTARIMGNSPLEQRVTQAAEATLAEQGYVSAVD